MGMYEDPTAYEAMSNITKEKYVKVDEKYIKPLPPKNDTMVRALAKALGTSEFTAKDEFVSPYTDIISLSYSGVIKDSIKINLNKKFPNSDKLSIVSVRDNIVMVSPKIPRGVKVEISYKYRLE